MSDEPERQVKGPIVSAAPGWAVEIGQDGDEPSYRLPLVAWDGDGFPLVVGNGNETGFSSRLQYPEDAHSGEWTSDLWAIVVPDTAHVAAAIPAVPGTFVSVEEKSIRRAYDVVGWVVALDDEGDCVLDPMVSGGHGSGSVHRASAYWKSNEYKVELPSAE